MTIYLRQSTASQEVPLGYFVDSTDGNTEKTGLTINASDIKVWKTGASTIASKNSGGATHISNGIYYITLDATDTDTLGPIVLFTHVAGALTVRLEGVVLAPNIYDSMILGTDLLDTSVVQWTGTNVATPDTAGYPKVTVKSGTGNGELNLSSGTILGDILLTGTASAGGADSITLAASASTTTGLYVGSDIAIISGTGAGQSRQIVGYTASRVAIVARPWITTPDNTSVYALSPDNSVQFIDIGLAQAGAASTITLQASASATDNIYNGEVVRILSGTGDNQIRVITGYVGSTKVATVDRAWTTNPDSTSYYSVMQYGIASVGSYQTGMVPLQPTTAGRTLDVSATGEAGLDWANIGSPTTTVNLSGTTISTSQTITSVSGSVGSVTGAVGSVTGSVGSVTGAVGSVTGNVGGNVVGSVASVTGNVGGNVVGSVASVTGNVGGNVVGSVASVTAAVTLSAKDTLAVRNNTAQAGGGSTITLDASASATDNFYNGEIIKIDSGTGAGQTRAILSYVGATKVATVDRAWITNPDNTSVFTIAAQNAPKLTTALETTVGGYASGQAPLQPTVAGRTLDVTTTGEAGIDWANIGAPTTTVNLSGTTISTSQVVASVTGAVGSVTGAVGSVTGAVGSVTGNVGGNVVGSVASVTGNVGGNVTGSVGSVATGGITSSSFAASAINAAAIASSAITAAKFAADAIDSNAIAATGASEIAAAVWDQTTSGHTTSGTFGQAVTPIRANTAQAGAATSITLDASASATNDLYTNDLITITAGTGVGQTRQITAYNGTTKVATVATWATNPDNTSVFFITPFASATGSSPATIAAAVWDEARASHTTAGSFGQGVASVQGNVTGSVGSVTGAVGSVTGAVGSVTGNVGGNVVGSVASVTGNVGGNVVGSVASVTGNVGGSVASVTGNVGGNVVGSVASVTAAVTLNAKDTPVIRNNTAQAGAAGTITLDASANATDNFYNGTIIKIDSGTGAGQARVIASYVGATKVATLDRNWVTNPDNTSVFTVVAADSAKVNSSLEVTVGAYASSATPLQPTVSGRTLDVSATGEAGLDWANIGSPTTTVNLSGTTISTSQTITSVSGSVGSVTGAVGSVTGAVGSVTGNVGGNVVGSVASVTGNVGGNVTGSVGSVVGAVGSVTAGVTVTTNNDKTGYSLLAKDSLIIRNNTAQAGGASTITLDASANATDNFYNGTVIKIDSGTGLGQARVIATYVGATKVATVDRNWVTNPDNTSVFTIMATDSAKLNSSLEVISASVTGTVGSVTGAVGSVTGAVGSVTGNVGGNVVGTVASVVGAVGSVTGNVGGNVTGSVGSVATGGITSSSFAASAINAAAIASSAITAAKFATDAIDSNAIAATGASEIAAAVWDLTTSGHITSGTFGQAVAPIRAGTAQAGAGSTITLDAGASATNSFYNDMQVKITSGTGAGQVRLIAGYVGATKVATITPAWATNPDNTSVFTILDGAYADVGEWLGVAPNVLSSGRVDSSVGAYQSGLTPLQPTTAGRTLDVSATGEAGIDWANVGSPATAVNLSATTISTSQVVASVTGAVGSVTGAVGSVTGSVGSVTGNVGGNVTGSVGSVATGGITASSFAAGAIDAAAIATDAIGSAEIAASAATEIAGAVWDIVLASHLTAGTTGAALNAAGSAGDPWVTALPGSYTAGQAGYIVGTNLDALVSSRLAPTTSGRTLDVTATGEAGIDWANIGSPTTTVNLSGTSISTSQVVASVTGAVGSVTGAVGSVTGNVGGNVTGSVGSVTGNVGGNVVGSVASVTGNVGGNVVGSVASVTAAVTLNAKDTLAIRNNTAQAGGASTITLDASANATDNFYNGSLIKLDSGTGAGQVRTILSYVGATKVATVDRNWVTNPDNTSVFTITADDNAKVNASLEVTVGGYASGQAPLQPTVAGRTLDVTTTGEAGIDWANIGAPTTTVNLSGTTISTSQVVASVTGAVGSVTGNVGGNVVGSVASVTGNVGGNVVGSVASVTGNVGGSVASVTGNVGGNVVGSVGSVTAAITLSAKDSFVIRNSTAQAGAAGSITLDASASATTDFYVGDQVKLDSGTGAGQVRTITAYNGTSKVATIDRNWATNPDNTSVFTVLATNSEKLNASLEVVAASVTGNISGSVASVVGAVGSVTGNVGGNVTGSVGSVVGAVGSVTGNVGGNVTGSVGSIATGGITSSSFASGAIDAAAIATDAITSVELATSAVTEIAGAVWDITLASHLTGGTTGAALNAAGSAGDPWATALPGAYSAGSAGFILGTNLDAAVTTRLAPTTSGRTLDVTATGEAGIDWGNIGSPTTSVNLSGTTISTSQVVASVTGSVGSVTGAVGSVTGSVGSVTGAVGSVTGNVGGNVVGSVGSVVGNVGGNVTGSVGSVTAAVTLNSYDTRAIRSNTAQAGAAGSITLDAGASAVTDFYVGTLVELEGGTGAGQARTITAYNGTSKVATVDRNWATAPDNTTTFTVVASDNAKTNSSLEVIAASVTGAVGSVTGSVGSVTGSVGSVTGNVGGNVVGSVASVTGNVGGNVTGSVGSIATGGITSSSFAASAINAAAIASSAITAAKFATDAIDSNALAATAVTEIQSGLATSSAVSAIQADTDDIQTRLPAALVSGRMDASVGAYQTGLAPLQPTTAGRTLDVSTTGEAGIDWANVGSPTTAVNLSGTTISTSQVVASVTGAVGSVTGSVGSVTGAVGSVTGNVGGNVVGSVASVTGNVGGNVTGSVGSVVAGVTVTTNNDKTGYSLIAKDSFIIRNSTAQAGAGSTITLDASASATDNFYNGTMIKLDSGTGAGQVRVVSGYVGATKVATVDRAWVTNPDNTSVFTVMATDSAKLNSSLEVVAASVTGNVSGSVASVVGAVGSVTGAVGSVTGNVGGNVVGSVASVTGNVGGNVTGTVGSVVGAVGSVTGNVGGNVTGSVGSIATGGITSSSFAASAINAAAIASSAITAAKFATDAIDNNALAASAVTEIQTGLATSSALATVQSDTDDIQTRLPAALVSGRMDVSVGAYQTGLAPLQPTTAGRTLDVSLTGEAGIDWANIGSPTTTVNLSGTTISTSQVVASVTGAVGSVTGSVGSVTGAVGSVTGNVGGNVTGSVGSIATGGITASSFASGAIDAAAIATDAITSVELATSAVTEIAGAVWDEARASHTTAGSFGQGVASVQGNVTGSVASVTGNVGGNVVGSVASVTGNVGGNVVGSIGSVATGGITSASFASGAIDASAIATDAITSVELASSALSEIAGAVWDEAASGHVSAGSFGVVVQSSLRTGTAQAGSSNTITLDAGASASNSFYNDQIIRISGGTGANQSRVISAYNGTSKVATVSSNWVVTPDNTSEFVIQAFGVSTASTPSAIATAVWEEATSSHTTAGTFGQSQQPVRSGTAQGGASNTITLDAGASGSNSYYNDSLILITGGTGAGQARGISAYVGSTKVATVTSAWTTNPNNTSVFVIYPFAFGAASSPSVIASAVWEELRSAHTNTGTFGEGISSVQGDVTGDLGGNVVGSVASVTGNIGGNVTGSVGSVTGNVGGNVTGSVGSIATGGIVAASFATDSITNTALAASAVTEIQSGLATASALSSVQSDTDDIQTRLPAALISGRLDVSVGAYQTGLAPLQPTTAGRTLDVSATGEAGIDWANIGSPTTSVNLSGTTISTSQVVASVTGAVGSVTGAVGSVTGNVGGNVVGTVASVVGAVGSVTGNVGGNVVGSVASVTGNVGGNVVGSVASVTGNVGGNVVGTVGSVVGAVGSVTSAVTLTAKDSFVVRNGTAQSGAGSTITLDAGASATDSLYVGESVKIDSGTGAGQVRRIITYVGSTKVATVDRAWITNPDNTSVFTVIADEGAKVDSSLQVTAASVQGNVTGSVASVTGSVGSVTGAVGSVTGNVGGNVVGTVASVVGAVGSVTGNVGGNVTGSVGSVATGGITSSSFASGAIDAAAIATDAITSAELATTAVTEIAGAVWDIVLSGHLTAGTTGASLNAAGSAGDPWTTTLPGSYSSGQAGFILGTNLNATVSSRLATSGYTAPDNATIGTINTKLGTPTVSVSDDIASVQSDTNDIQTRLPAALVSGRMASDAVAISGSTVAADAVESNISNLDATISSRAPSATALSTVQWTNTRASNLDNLDEAVSTTLAAADYVIPPTVGAIADAVWDEPIASHANAGSTGEALTNAGTPSLNPTDISDAVWNATRSSYVVSGSFGQGVASVQGNVTGSVASVTGAVGSVTGAVGSVTGNVGGNVVGSIGSLGVTAKSDVNAEVDTALSDIRLDELMQNALTADPAVNSLFGDLTQDNGSGTQQFTATALEHAPSSGGGGTDWTLTEKAQIRYRLGLDGTSNTPSATPDLARETAVDAIQADVDTLLSDVGAVQTAVDAVQTTVNGIQTDVGSVLTDIASVQGDTNDIQTRLPASLIGGRMASDAIAISGSTATADTVEANIGNLDAAITTRAAAATALSTAQWTNLRAANLDNLDEAISSTLAAADYVAAPNVGAIADAVWDELLSGHLTIGSTGNRLNAAASAGDPWATDLPGGYAAGEAGYILGNLTSSGGGSGDWSTTELQQIRYRLGIDGVSSVPTASSHITCTGSGSSGGGSTGGTPIPSTSTELNLYAAAAFEATITGANVTGPYTKLTFTAKLLTTQSLYAKDSLIQITDDDGLKYLNSAAVDSGSAALGSLTIDGSNIVIAIDELITVALPEAYGVKWDIKKTTTNGVNIIASGIMNIRRTLVG